MGSKIDKSKQVLLNGYILDSGDKLHQQTKLHTMKGLFEINDLYKIKMDTVNSDDYMKIEWEMVPMKTF